MYQTWEMRVKVFLVVFASIRLRPCEPAGFRAYPKTHQAMTPRIPPSEERRGRAEDAVPTAGGLSFRAGRRCLFGGKTALGIPARTSALPGTKTQAIMVPAGFRIGS
jgi:hypothetical protein